MDIRESIEYIYILGSDIYDFSERGVSIVHPDNEVRIVLFGWWLDEVLTFGFTLTENCSQTSINVSQADFTIQTEKRVVIKYIFES